MLFMIAVTAAMTGRAVNDIAGDARDERAPVAIRAICIIMVFSLPSLNKVVGRKTGTRST